MEDSSANAAACQHVSMARIILGYFLYNYTLDSNASMWPHPGDSGSNYTGYYASEVDYFADGSLDHAVGPSSTSSSSVEKHSAFNDEYDTGQGQGHGQGQGQGQADGHVDWDLFTSPSSSSSPTWFRFVIPAISTVGIAGNLLSIVVLTRQRLLSTMQRLERSVTHCLTALAASDLLFCVAVLPQGGFLDEDVDDTDDGVEKSSLTSSSPLTLAYRVYGVAIVNLLLMQSTWMVTMMAACRYLVVVYPLFARQRLTGRVTVVSIAAVVGVSAIATAPHFVATSVSRCWTFDVQTHQLRWHYEMIETKLYQSISFYVRWVWPVCSTFIPLAALGAFNVRLVRELSAARRSMSSTGCGCIGRDARETPSDNCYVTNVRRTASPVGLTRMQLNDGLTVSRTTAAGRKVTLTLTVIILMNLSLVTPSELLKYANSYGHVVAYVANAMQALNFAVNFFLYCILNPHFRLTVTRMFGCRLRQAGQDARRAGGVFERRSAMTSSTVVSLRMMRRGQRRPFDQRMSMKASSCTDVGILMSGTSSPTHYATRRRALDSQV